ncbi:isochorismatase family protein [Mangrovibrevibacter kandeliae]|uniref:isochorismatase family protein n=1 Tax=Mangrovibrevibacter kandeliae TaxID=2968473 RepID=UPI0021199C7A|nr:MULTISPECIES: isochorismatase family protein [unclassified Aurantimonas]MCQ8781140.1 isochorismatase family protein [Aurantimonas sp. CSK15Z-1]MCW4113920.1 isochorismatase family protein [Aurantimonas sp. MSK8Z-1]
MTLSTLDPRSALILIDLQKGILGLPTAHPADRVAANASRLAAAFRQKGLPVVVVNVAGSPPGRAERSFRADQMPADWTELDPRFGLEPTDHRITKRTWGAFTGTGLEAFLRKEAVTQVVLAGVATTGGVESTGRFAQELGFNVTYAVDAMTDMSLEAHENSVTRIFPRIGETGTTHEIVTLLDRPAA